MQELEFRIWNTKLDRWYKGGYIYNDGSRSVEYRDETFQGTITGPDIGAIFSFYWGLKDIRGEKIFTGDIIEVVYINYKETDKESRLDPFISEVFFHEGYSAFVFSEGNEVRFFLHRSMEIRKLGNKFENPELLEEPNK